MSTPTTSIETVSIIGAGNVGFHIGLALRRNNIRVEQVWSRTLANATRLGELLNCQTVREPGTLNPKTDLFLLAVKDDAIQEVSQALPDTDGIVAHTSGSTSVDVLPQEKRGVFYPLQTFNKDRPIAVNEIPFFVEGNAPQVLQALTDLGQKLSKEVYASSFEQRKFLHMAAIFACNFTNHLYHMADELLADQEVDQRVLYPLIRETVERSRESPPAETQTGPARRGDMEILKEHLHRLEQYPSHQRVYRLLSNEILKAYHGEEL